MELNAFYLDRSDDSPWGSTDQPHAPGEAAPDQAPPARRIAAMIARIEAARFGHVLHLSPLHATDVARRWAALCGSYTAGTVLIDDPAARHGRPAALAGIPEDPAQLSAPAFAAFVDRLGLGQAVAVLVDGPADHRDVAAMESALARGRSPLEAELRAEGALRLVAPRTIRLDLRRRTQAGPIIGEALRQYVAAMRKASAETVAMPDEAILFELIEESDFFELRPGETESHSTAMDITLRLDAQGHTSCLVYDYFANSWHGD